MYFTFGDGSSSVSVIIVLHDGSIDIVRQIQRKSTVNGYFADNRLGYVSDR